MFEVTQLTVCNLTLSDFILCNKTFDELYFNLSDQKYKGTKIIKVIEGEYITIDCLLEIMCVIKSNMFINNLPKTKAVSKEAYHTNIYNLYETLFSTRHYGIEKVSYERYHDLMYTEVV